jgi:hypothetical protein
MLIVLASPDAILKYGKPDAGVVGSLINATKAGNPVAIVSNNLKPDWFDAAFQQSGVQFLREYGRQNGKVISRNAAAFKLNPFDVLVLAANESDVRMGKNGPAVLVAAGWVNCPEVNDLGIRVDDSNQLNEVIELSSKWAGQWWFAGDTGSYNIRALADLSQYYKTVDQRLFGEKVTATVKKGGPRLNALLAMTARSLMNDSITNIADLWGVYPSSDSNNLDQEVLSDFTHRLRTTASRVMFATRGKPLFIRHQPSVKRSTQGVSVDRTDPSNQLLTVHLNPYYESRIRGRRAVIIDDCTTYGVSFGVAAALLKSAGARSVTGVALGKFGNQLLQFDIVVTGNPYAPLSANDFKVNGTSNFSGQTNSSSQADLLLLIP